MNKTPWALALAALPYLTTSYAQAPAKVEEPVVLEKIKVTSQRRDQNLQDVPVAVTALNRQALDSRGISSIGDLSAVAPGLQVTSSPGNAVTSQIAIRGNVTGNPAIYWDTSVGVYLDGVYIGKSQGSIFDVVDLNRVEVLRGPQGTLFGRNTIAGAINLITRDPSGEFGGSTSLELGNYSAFVQKLALDLPKLGIASISLAGRIEQREGWVDRENADAQNLNNRDNAGLRAAVKFDFTPRVRGDYRFDYSNSDQNGQFGQLDGANSVFFSFVPGFENLPSFASQKRKKEGQIDGPSFEKSEIQGHSFTLKDQYNDKESLKSITAYRHLSFEDSLDLDGSPLPLALAQRDTTYAQVSQELQYQYISDRLNFVGGFYYFTDEGDTNNPQTYFGGGANFDSRYATETNVYSVFAQADYKIIPELTLTGGIRYTRESKALDRVFGASNAPGAPFFYFIPEGTSAKETFTKTNPLVSIAYAFTERTNVYLRYAEGFKSGGFNGEYSNTMATPEENIAETQTPFKPEQQRSLELGFKTSFWQDRAQLNVAAFYNKLKDLQIPIFTATGAAATVIRNAAEATTHGIELEGSIIPFKGTRLSANYAYLDGEYDRFMDAGVDVSDNRAFVRAPKNTFNIVVDSTLVNTRYGKVKALADYIYTSSYYSYPYQLANSGPGFNPGSQTADNTKVDGYGLLNLRLALSQIPVGDGAQGELSLFCRNALDEDTATNYIDFGPGFGNLTTAYYQDPITFGINAALRW